MDYEINPDAVVTIKPPEDNKPLIPIVITGVEGGIKNSSDFTRITCFELSNIVVSGAVDVQDYAFSMPLRRDDGRLILFAVQVTNGEFKAVLNFPTSGQYVYTDEQANHDLPFPMFTVDHIKIDVLRKPL